MELADWGESVDHVAEQAECTAGAAEVAGQETRNDNGGDAAANLDGDRFARSELSAGSSNHFECESTSIGD